MDETRLKISDPERIARILRRICGASLQVMIRTSGQMDVAVKGRAANILTESVVPTMRISNVSDRGMAHLKGRRKVQVEFVMMSTKVVFVSTVIYQEHNSLLVRLPTSLVSVERRKNARYPCTSDIMAFICLSLWKPQGDDMTAPPFFRHHAKVSSYIHVVDLSFGGLCAITKFPSINNVLRRGIIDDNAKLILPMQRPLHIPVEIRWSKKIKEHVKYADDTGGFVRSYRFGVEFKGQSDDNHTIIRQFLQQLAQAEAI